LNNVAYKANVKESYGHPEGRIRLDGTAQQYQYALSDHLGNLAVFFEDADGDGIAEVLQRHYYYSYGMEMEGAWNSAGGNVYRYNGKERVDDLGLNWYFYGARMYDFVNQRFTGVDPIAEQYPFVTTYNYAEDSPIANIDLWGLQKFTVTPQMVTGGLWYNAGVYSNADGIRMAKTIAKDVAKEVAITLAMVVAGEALGLGLDYMLGAEVLGAEAVIVSQEARVVSRTVSQETRAASKVSIHTPKMEQNGARLLEKDAAKGGFKTLSELGLKDGMKVSSSRALELGEQFLGKGYKELVQGSGRYVSADGTRVFRIGVSDITGAHGGGSHVNFETLIPNPAKAGKMMVDQNFHIYLTH
jgi:RHS repeat-associated protein